MRHPRGLCLISVPKSGTMFVSRYLAQWTGSRVVFGLDGGDAPTLMRGLSDGWHPAIAAATNTRSHDLATMTRRFAQMLSRNRVPAAQESGPVIYSDHGLHSFLSFLINPRITDLQDPAQVCSWASERHLAPVFLYRDIRGIANSLAHFLASGKSFLLGLRDLPEACDLVVRLHAPVLAQQMRTWRRQAGAHGVLCVAYEDVMAQPRHWLGAICRHGQLPWAANCGVDAPNDYRSWTYRRSGGDWAATFTGDQQNALNALAATA